MESSDYTRLESSLLNDSDGGMPPRGGSLQHEMQLYLRDRTTNVPPARASSLQLQCPSTPRGDTDRTAMLRARSSSSGVGSGGGGVTFRVRLDYAERALVVPERPDAALVAGRPLVCAEEKARAWMKLLQGGDGVGSGAGGDDGDWDAAPAPSPFARFSAAVEARGVAATFQFDNLPLVMGQGLTPEG